MSSKEFSALHGFPSQNQPGAAEDVCCIGCCPLVTASKKNLTGIVQDIIVSNSCATFSSKDTESLAHKRPLCSYCVKQCLTTALEQHKTSLEARKEAEKEYEEFLLENKNIVTEARILQLKQKSRLLRDRLQMLKNHASAAALRLCAGAVENEQRQARIDQERKDRQADNTEELLHRLRTTLVVNHNSESNSASSLAHVLYTSRQRARVLRFQWACTAFLMHRLQIDSAVFTKKQSDLVGLQQKRARGVGKICGLPLPHAGPELYGVLPPDELQSALRMVASLTNLVSRCLGILLPHPILLRPLAFDGSSPGNGDIADCQRDEPCAQRPHSSNSTEQELSLEALAECASKRILHTPTKQIMPGGGQYVSPPSMDPQQVRERIFRSQTALLAENESAESSTYALQPPSDKDSDNDSFGIALQLLQNNVVALCIRAGVPVTNLWPAQAVLLNLHALQAFCQLQVQPPMQQS